MPLTDKQRAAELKRVTQAQAKVDDAEAKKKAALDERDAVMLDLLEREEDGRALFSKTEVAKAARLERTHIYNIIKARETGSRARH